MNSTAIHEQVQRIHIAAHAGTVDLEAIDDACSKLDALADSNGTEPAPKPRKPVSRRKKR